MLASFWHVLYFAFTQFTHCHEKVSFPVQLRGTVYDLRPPSKVPVSGVL